MASTVNLGQETIVLSRSGKFEFHVCGTCGVEWGMPVAFLEERRYDGDWWYCPNGHQWHWPKGSTERHKKNAEIERLKDKLAREQARADQTEASLRATKGHLTRQKKRAAAGTCPCCNRTFKQLADHTQRQHPDFVERARTK